MATAANSVNEATTGICGFTGTAFTGTAVTNHAVIVGGSTSSTLTNIAATSNTGAILQNNSGADPSYSTATYPSTTTSQQILYSTATNVVGQLTTANSKFPATNASGTLAMRGLSVVRQVFTNTGTYTPTTGMVYCDIICAGGGGAGGGAQATGGATTSCGGGGGAGEYAQGTFSAATIGGSQSVTIGAGGTGNSGTTGGNGGTTSVGSTVISAAGGTGGPTGAAATNSIATGGQGGTGGTGGDFRVPGVNGGTAFTINLPGVVYGSFGGSSFFGPGAGGIAATGNGIAGSGNASGGGGALNYNNQASATTGGNGVKGIVVITEYVIN